MQPTVQPTVQSTVQPNVQSTVQPSSAWIHRQAVELLLAVIVFFACAYFFTGGSWNSNAHLATVMSIVDDGTFYIDRYRDSTGDIAHTPRGTVSSKAIGAPIVAIPAYIIAKVASLHMTHRGNQLIVRAYITTALTMGAVMALLTVVLYRTLRRRVEPRDAAVLALAVVLATPLFPNAAMISQHVMTALAAFASYSILERWRLRRLTQPENPRQADESVRLESWKIALAGFLGGLAPVFEYPSLIVLIPLTIYALWSCRLRFRIAWFLAGVGVALLIPMTYHTVFFGGPFKTAYSALVRPEFIAIHRQGFMGFDHFSWLRLYELTLGRSRGLFLLSPFLVASIPGLTRMIRAPATRPEGITVGVIAWSVLLFIASFVNWHSGSAVGSRFIHIFIVFSCVPLAAIYPHHRGWMQLGIAVSFFLMLVAISVTSVPPPPDANVLQYYFEHFFRGDIAWWQGEIIKQEGIGTGAPTYPFAFNLGIVLGLPGLWSLLPFGVVMAGLSMLLARRLRIPHRHANTAQHST
ncbi:MAG: PT domain-containing protein [Deltaproteobacteria bacterium]|nr:PT domain-containing protein [Deltaproteobacteria bacterium]